MLSLFLAIALMVAVLLVACRRNRRLQFLSGSLALVAVLCLADVADARPLVGGRILARGLFGRRVVGRGLIGNIRARVLANRLERAQIRGAIVAQNVVNANVVHAAFRQRVLVNHQFNRQFAFNAASVYGGYGAQFAAAAYVAPQIVLQPAFVPAVAYAAPACAAPAVRVAGCNVAPAVAGETVIEHFDGNGQVRARAVFGQ